MSGTLHQEKPFRNVVFIEETTSARGARYWRLTLDCEHLVFRRIPTSSLTMVPLVRMDEKKRKRGPVLSAPHRVKCLFCPDGAESSPTLEKVS